MSQMTASEANAKLESLLTILVPLSTKIVDENGNTYEVKTAFSAAKQYRFNALLKQKLASHPGLAGILSAGASDIKNVGSVILSASSDPVVIQTLSEAFEILHPNILAQAKAAAGEIDAKEIEAVGLAGALFGLEELVKAIIPFALRQLRGLIETMMPMIKAMNTTSTLK